MIGFLSSLVLVSASVGTFATDADWKVVDWMIEQFKFLPNVSFSAGDSTGRKHSFEKGSITMQTPNFMASSSKFPAVVAITGAVVDGHLSFDTRVNEVFSWWSTDPKDSRSHVTLRSLLYFASGLVSSDFADCGVKCLSNPFDAPEACAREIFTTGPWVAMPGTVWSYHSLHLQVAGAMAAKAANLTVPGLIKKYLVDRVGMIGSYWLGGDNPHLAATMISTGDDYDKLLQMVLTYEIAPKEIVDQMELDSYRYYPELKCSPYPKDVSLGFYGHYSMGTYFECVGQPWNEGCEKAGIHADPGALGYWPLVDRSKGYYMQIVTMRPVSFPHWFMRKYHITSDTLAALPGHCTSALRFGMQGAVEKALLSPSTSLAAAPLGEKDDPLSALCVAAQLPIPPKPPTEHVLV